MKLSLNWLNTYLSQPLTDVAAIEHALTLLGFEVEGVDTLGMAPIENVVVGEVLSKAQHPDAERLSVCDVRVSTDINAPLHSIVCGAKNFEIGNHVPVALPGAKLPGGVKIKRSKLRGVVSEGMLCAAGEIGLADLEDGLLVFEKYLPSVGLSAETLPELGTPVHTVFAAQTDSVLHVELTPNRPDCLSVIGLARELAAWFKCQLVLPAVPQLSEFPNTATVGAVPANELAVSSVHISPCAQAACAQYSAFNITGVKVQPSPAWLVQRLEAIGLRPINNVVDVTNFVLHETGQPLHAFNAQKIGSNCLNVRMATKGETLKGLDEKTYALSPEVPVIASGQAHESKPLALAGIMGGLESGVSEGTENIVLEAAVFEPKTVRNAGRNILNISTDSSYRFERGVNAAGTAYAARRALALILELAGGTLCLPAKGADATDADALEATSPHASAQALLTPPVPITFTSAWVNERCGFAIKPSFITSALQQFEFEVAQLETDQQGRVTFRATPPSFRRDMLLPEDIVEEVVRLHGSDNIPPVPVKAPGLTRKHAPAHRICTAAANQLAALGLHECVHYTLRPPQETQTLFGAQTAHALRVSNPLAEDQGTLRPSLLPGLAGAAQYNANQQSALALGSGYFETGRTFALQSAQKSAPQLTENTSIAALLPTESAQRTWQAGATPNFFAAKALGLKLLGAAGIHTQEGKGLHFEALHSSENAEQANQANLWQPGHSAIATGNVGRNPAWALRCGVLNLAYTGGLGLSAPMLGIELTIYSTHMQLLAKKQSVAKFQPMSTFPATQRDVAIIAPAATPAANIQATAAAAANAALKAAGNSFNLTSCNIFDAYTGEELPENTRSIALQLTFRSHQRTLTDDEVTAIFNETVNALKAGGYTVR